MDEIAKSIHEIYDNRERYIIIGLTGRTGSGCSTAASILNKPFSDLKLAKPKYIADNANEERKFLIIKRFIKNNWSPFVWFKIKDIITSFILEVEKKHLLSILRNISKRKMAEIQKRLKLIFFV